jgi:arsenate reductase
MSDVAPFKVLFLCTGNSSRSVFGEFLLRKRGNGVFETCSAGTNPRGELNLYTIRLLRECYQIDATGARPKSAAGFFGKPFDFVITVCDQATKTCPVWPARTAVAHWSSPDPSAFRGSDQETFDFFRKVAMQIQRRVDLLCSLPIKDLDHDRRERASRAIGEQE